MLSNIQVGLVIGIVIAIVAIIGYFITRRSIDTWYSRLKRSRLSPPNITFGIVWTSLYILIGIATYLAYTRATTDEQRNIVLSVFGIQIGLNLLWTIMFFGAKQIAASGAEILALLITIIINIFVFYPIDKTAAYLLIPYALWVGYASALNIDTARLNVFEKGRKGKKSQKGRLTSDVY